MLRQLIFYQLKPSSKRTIEDVHQALETLKASNASLPKVRSHSIGLATNPLQNDFQLIATMDFDSVDDAEALKTDAGAMAHFQVVGKIVGKMQVMNVHVE